jgi:hypothetical protein
MCHFEDREGVLAVCEQQYHARVGGWVSCRHSSECLPDRAGVNIVTNFLDSRGVGDFPRPGDVPARRFMTPDPQAAELC